MFACDISTTDKCVVDSIICHNNLGENMQHNKAKYPNSCANGVISLIL